jgi:hypothetical protein
VLSQTSRSYLALNLVGSAVLAEIGGAAQRMAAPDRRGEHRAAVGARSYDRWIPGRTPKRRASTAASRCCWSGWRCSSWSSRAPRYHRPQEAALIVTGALAARWLARDLRAHPPNFPDPTPSHGLPMAVTRADGRRRSGRYG